jgi:hypothetical protein
MTVALKGQNRCGSVVITFLFAPFQGNDLSFSPPQGVALGCLIAALQAVPGFDSPCIFP